MALVSEFFGLEHLLIATDEKRLARTDRALDDLQPAVFWALVGKLLERFFDVLLAMALRVKHLDDGVFVDVHPVLEQRIKYLVVFGHFCR